MSDPSPLYFGASPPTTCASHRQYLHALVDGELHELANGATLQATLGAHLHQCPPCAQLERQLQAMRRALRAHAHRLAAHPDEQASAALRERIARLFSR